MRILYLSCVYTLVSMVCTTSFLIPTRMSVVHVKDTNSIKRMKESDLPKVVLVTGKGCRACIEFKKKFLRMEEENKGIEFYKIVLNDFEHDVETRSSLYKYAQEKGIKTVPTVIFQDIGREDGTVSLVSGVRKNYDLLDTKMQSIKSSPYGSLPPIVADGETPVD